MTTSTMTTSTMTTTTTTATAIADTSAALPPWLSDLTLWIDDSSRDHARPGQAREYARLRHASRGLTAGQWARLDYRARRVALVERLAHCDDDADARALHRRSVERLGEWIRGEGGEPQIWATRTARVAAEGTVELATVIVSSACAPWADHAGVEIEAASAAVASEVAGRIIAGIFTAWQDEIASGPGPVVWPLAEAERQTRDAP